MMHHTLVLTYKNEAGEVDTIDIEVDGVYQDVISAGKKFLRSIGLTHEAILKADVRCPAFISMLVGGKA